MNKAYLVLAAAGLTLAACGGKGDDAAGDKVASDADAAATTMENQADSMNGAAADQMNAQADAVRDAGAQAEESIDDADVQTNNPAATAAKVEQQSGLPTSADTASEAAKGQ